jgi:hypothetical protein
LRLAHSGQRTSAIKALAAELSAAASNQIRGRPAPLNKIYWSKVMQHSEFVVIKGHPLCLTRGLVILGNRKRKGFVVKQIQTIEYTKPREMKLVTVDQFDMVTNKYETLGEFYADVVTGTLYDPETGKCLSSDQISLVV